VFPNFWNSFRDIFFDIVLRQKVQTSELVQTSKTQITFIFFKLFDLKRDINNFEIMKKEFLNTETRGILIL